MATNNSFFGFVPVPMYNIDGTIAETLYRLVCTTPVSADPRVESDAPVEAHTEEVEEAGAAFVAALAPPDEDGGITAEMEAAFEKFERQVADEAEAEAWWHAQVEKDEEEQRHVAGLLFVEDKTPELYDMLQAMVKLKHEHDDFQNQLYEMRQVKSPKERNANNAKYKKTQTADKAVLTAWLEEHARFATLFDKCKSLDEEFDATFNAYVKTRHPGDPDRDYRKLNAFLARKFNEQINGKKPAVGKPAPGTEKPAPKPATLAEIVSARLANEAAGGGRAPRAPALSALKGDSDGAWGDM